jgi:tetratricopeptide (TPR) repeat protein
VDDSQGPSSLGLDARLLRFRARTEGEEAAPLAEALLEARRTDEALEVVAAGLRSAPGDARLLRVEGQAWFASGQLQRAQAALVAAGKAAPHDPAVFRVLGELLLERGDVARAVKVLERAAALAPGDTTIAGLVARATRAQGDVASPSVAPPSVAPPSVAPPSVAPPSVAPPSVAPPSVARPSDESPSVASPSVAPPSVAPPSVASPSDESLHASDAAHVSDPVFPGPSLPPVESPASVPSSVVFEALSAETLSPEPPSGEMVAAPFSSSALPVIEPSPAIAPPGVAEHSAAPRPAPPRPLPWRAPPLRSVPPPRPAPAAKAELEPGSPIEAAPSYEAEGERTFVADPARIRAALEDDARLARAEEAAATAALASESTFAAQPLVDPSAASSADPSAASPVEEAASVSASVGETFEAPFPPSTVAVEAAATETAIVEVLAGNAVALPESADDASAPKFDVSELEAASDDQPLAGAAPLADSVAVASVDAALDQATAASVAPPDAASVAPPESSSAVPSASSPHTPITRRSGRAGRIAAAVAVLALLLAGGGWFYARAQRLAQERAAAATFVASVQAEARDGDHASLLAAEVHLREAAAIAPTDAATASVAAWLATQRALEDGAADARALRASLESAQAAGADDAAVAAAGAVLAALEGNVDEARRLRDAAVTAQPREALVRYVAGRLAQRFGEPDAETHLVAATADASAPHAARLALAELRATAGRSDAATELVGAVLAARSTHLRALLWQYVLIVDEAEIVAVREALAALAPRVDAAAKADRLLAAVVSARLERRSGDVAAAGAAIDRAVAVGVREPRLLAMLATEAQRVGRLAAAKQTAESALAAAPTNASFRRGLAEVQLALHDGAGALATLGTLPPDDLRGAVLTARAALLLGAPDALARTRQTLDAMVAAHPTDVEARALAVRVAVRLGDAARLEDAKALAREAPLDPLVALALGEAALAVRDPATATQALERLVIVAPGDADVHFLLGRARRMGGLAEGAEASFRRALTLAPEHSEAAIALGGLLLDAGKFEEAEQLYGTLAASPALSGGAPVAAFGRLGRVEALVGLGRVTAAHTALDALAPDERALPSTRLAAARLMLAEGAASGAVEALRALADDAGTISSEVLSLYGDALFETGEVDLAAQQYDAALALDAGAPEALLGRARVALRAERAVDVRLYVDRLKAALLSRVRPPSLRARLLVVEGRLALLLRDVEAARALLREATTLPGAPAEAHFFLGEAIVGVDTAATRAAYERYLELAPAGEFADRARRVVSP